MTLKEKLIQAKKYGYTLKFIAENCDISPNTLYAFMGDRDYNFKKDTEEKINNFLDTLYYDNHHNYTVYMHRNKINNKIYIGLTSMNVSQRWGRNGEKYKDQPHFYRAIQKYGWENFEHIIIKTSLTEEEASLLEKELINKYDTMDTKKGYNKREGGANKYKLTPEQIERLKWAKGKTFTENHKQKISEALKNRTFSEETRLKMREAKLIAGTFQGSNNPKAQKVRCIETNEIFNTLKDAAKWAGLKYGDSISKACRGISKTAAGFHWEYVI